MQIQSACYAVIVTVLALAPSVDAIAQDDNQCLTNACEQVLTSKGRGTLWQAIRAAAVNDANSTTSDVYFKRVVDHCEGNLRNEPALLSEWRDKCRSAPNQACYHKQLAKHCEWFLGNQGKGDWWLQIRDSAINDAGNMSSDYYYKRAGEHCSWWLNQNGRPDMWNQIEISARRDCS